MLGHGLSPTAAGPPVCPCRAPLATLSPWIPARRRIWASRPVHRKEDWREGPPWSAPRLPYAQPRTSPPCAPSLGFAFLPGKEKRSWLRHRLLKGQHRPSPLIRPVPAPPSPPNTCLEPPEAWVSPLRPSQGSFSGARWSGRAGPGGGIYPAALPRLPLLSGRRFRLGQLRQLCCRDPALAQLEADIRARPAGMLDSPPQRSESLQGGWRSLGFLPGIQPLRRLCQDLYLLLSHSYLPDRSWDWRLGKARHLFCSGNNQNC